ncbi:MAG: hypothetical protein JRF63_08240 [Deltaproteobacteria bacterium]|nr:hypothetical protein [Deltaproteobacteria bacterium]
MHVRSLKTVLWFLFGAGLTLILLRIINGPGAVVALTDMIPWGLWKGGGVVALVPIGGAGFTLAALVYVFHIERFRPLAVGAVLLGLMCYSSVAAGLTFDIGIWWRIVFPITHWQLHSTLFEIAWCIILYLCVLAVEFSHVVFAKLGWKRTTKVLHKMGIVFVIAGIALSTLHQSSLGTLFLATPYRLHPLWYTDLLPGLFLITAIGLGCLTISWAAVVTHWLYRAEQPIRAVSGLGRIASVVLGLFLVIRFAEIVISGEAALLFAPSWDTVNFWIECLLCAAIPVALLLFRRFRESPTAMFWISSMAVLGMSLNRVNVAGLATVSATHEPYLPAWTEWVVTFGILAGAGLVFLFCVERFGVFTAIGSREVEAAHDPGVVDHGNWRTTLFYNPQADVRVYSAFFVLAAGLTLGAAPDDALFGVRPLETPVWPPREVEVERFAPADGSRARFEVVAAEERGTPGGELVPVLMVDANRNGDYVLFDHESHIGEQAERRTLDRDDTCVLCHHMRKPYEKVSRCSDCHADMYLDRDIFDHDVHESRTGGNAGCAKCHQDPLLSKVRANTKPCAECHTQMRPAGTLVEVPVERQSTIAPGFRDAAHGLCVGCHQREQQQRRELGEDFARCTTCHAELPALESPGWESML